MGYDSEAMILAASDNDGNFSLLESQNVRQGSSIK